VENINNIPGICEKECSCCPNRPPVKPTPATCTGSGSIGHEEWEYEAVGFSPCAKYVAHARSNPCDFINNMPVVEVSKDPHKCECATSFCPCGEFLSHLISEPCTAK
jgi:hypothetical protein